MASAKEIPPGGEGKIDVTFKTKGRRGITSKSITVLSNDATEPRIRLAVKADLEIVIGVEPRSLNFGTIMWNETTTKPIELIGKDVVSTKILSVEIEDPSKGKKPIDPAMDHVAHKIRTEKVDGKLRTYLDITVGPDLNPGRFNGSLLIKTDHPKVPELSFRVMGKIRGPVDYRPERLFFSNLTPGTDQKRVLTISGIEGKSVEILSVSADHPSLTAKIASVKGETTTIEIVCNGNLKEPRVQATLTVVTSFPGFEKMEIPVSLYGKKDPPRNNNKFPPKPGSKESNMKKSNSGKVPASISSEMMSLTNQKQGTNSKEDHKDHNH